MRGKDIGRRGNSGVLFRNGIMDFNAGVLLAHAQQGGLSIGTLLHCFALIRKAGSSSWPSVFARAAAETERRAVAAADAAGGDPTGAAEAWLAAYVARRAALMMLDPRSDEARTTTASMERSFLSFVHNAGIGLEPWSVPVEGGTLPACITSNAERAEHLVVVIGGGDTYVEDLWFFGGKALYEAGRLFVMVDLPGKGSTPHQDLHFGPRTLDGLGAVLGALRDRGCLADITLLGWSGGGIFVTKYASVARPEDRLAAVIASGPIHDAEAMFRNAIPTVLQRDPASPLRRAVLGVARRNPVLRGALAKYDWQFGPAGITGVVTAFAEEGRTDLDALNVPFLALVGLGEDPESMCQARRVINAVKERHPASTIITFDAWTGADAHCQVGNLPLAMQEVLRWLADLWGRPTPIPAAP